MLNSYRVGGDSRTALSHPEHLDAQYVNVLPPMSTRKCALAPRRRRPATPFGWRSIAALNIADELFRCQDVQRGDAAAPWAERARSPRAPRLDAALAP